MIYRFLLSMRRLDLYLKAKIGFPIHLLLSIGIVGEIVRNMHDLTERFSAETAGSHLGALLSIAIGVLLLIHQFAEISESAERRRAAHRPN